jgi:HEAT repeat protein
MVLLAVLAALFGFGLLSVVRPGEPRYQGKPISYWLTLASNPSSVTASNPSQKKSDFQEAQDAITAIGPAALPFVASAISGSEPVWLRSYRQVVNKLPSSWGQRLAPRKRQPLNWLFAGSFFAEVAKIEGTNALPQLSQLASSKNPQVRRLIIVSLHWIRQQSPEATVPLLMRTMRDSDRVVQFDAVRELCEVAPFVPSVPQSLIAYLREHGTNVNSIIRSDIIGALAKAGSQIPGFADVAISSLAGTNVWQQAFAALVIWLRQPDADTKARAIAAYETAFRTARDERVFLAMDFSKLKLTPAQEESVIAPVLALGLRAQGEQLRAEAAECLARLGRSARTVVPALVAGLGDSNEQVQAYCLMALGETGTNALPALPRLIQLLRDHQNESGVAAVLAKLGPLAEHAVPTLIEALRKADDDWERLELLDALAAIGPSKANSVDAIIEFLAHKDQNTRLAAAQALARLGPAARDAAPALESAFRQDEYLEVRLDAAEALLRIDPNVGPELVSPLVQLIDWMGEDSPDNLAVAARRLGEIGLSAAVAEPALDKLLRNRSDKVRATAAEAMTKVNPHRKAECVEILREILRRAPAVAKAPVGRAVLALEPAYTPEVVDALIQAMGDRNGIAQLDAADLLIELGDKAEKAAPRLREVLANCDDPSVRRSARDALERIESHSKSASLRSSEN